MQGEALPYLCRSAGVTIRRPREERVSMQAEALPYLYRMPECR